MTDMENGEDADKDIRNQTHKHRKKWEFLSEKTSEQMHRNYITFVKTFCLQYPDIFSVRVQGSQSYENSIKQTFAKINTTVCGE